MRKKVPALVLLLLILLAGCSRELKETTFSGESEHFTAEFTVRHQFNNMVYSFKLTPKTTFNTTDNFAYSIYWKEKSAANNRADNGISGNDIIISYNSRDSGVILRDNRTVVTEGGYDRFHVERLQDRMKVVVVWAGLSEEIELLKTKEEIID